jgi:hypothetical protein
MSNDYFIRCPKCGEPRIEFNADDRELIYACGTIYCGGTCDSQSPKCYHDQMCMAAEARWELDRDQ